MKTPLQENTPLKVSIVVQDTWAIWNGEDKRGLHAPKFSNTLLQNWYGSNSGEWNALLKKTNLKPEIMFVGENPSKNNKKILAGNNLIIQCFHSSSVQDLLIKNVLEDGYFHGSYMTDAFDSAFEKNGKKITLKEIRKWYPSEWQQIFNKSRERFEELLIYPGRTIVIALGNEAFKYIIEFTKESFLKSDVVTVENDVAFLKLTKGKREWKVFKIYHPSPLNAKNRLKIPAQLESLKKKI